MKSVRIINDTGVAIGTRVIDLEGGNEIRGITGLTVHYRLDEPVRAFMDLLSVEHDTRAEGHFFVIHPKTGERAEIRALEFADGTRFEL